MSDTTRAMLLALYAATVAALACVERGGPLHRALCQVRVEIERACGLPQTPNRAERRGGVLQ